jgi:hypothetical protein
MKQVVVICYPNDWHWVLSAEFINSQTLDSIDIEVWDFSWAGELGIKNRIKRMIGGSKLQRDCKNWLKKHSAQVKSLNLNSQWRNHSSVREQLKSIVCEYEYLEIGIHRAIYNTVVEEVGNLQVNTKEYKNQIKIQLQAKIAVQNALSDLSTHDIARFITVNGRFTKNATVRDWAEANSIPLVLLEFGSTEETFEEFNVSPHSVSEVTTKMIEFWEAAPEKLRVEKARGYLSSIANNDVSKIQWRAKMVEADLPNFPQDKKICVYFASTESEEAGLGDPVKAGQFKSQVEAFQGLMESLPESEWHIFLRRHPRNPETENSFDPEEHLWESFLGVKNVTVIEPDASVDSIELGLHADLVANYWSGIAIELLIRGKNEVITLGDAAWNHFVPTNATRSRVEIKQFLSESTPDFAVETIYPWAYYYSSFGKPFELFQFDRSLAKWITKF